MLVRLVVCLALSHHLLCAGIRSVCHDDMLPELSCYDLWPPYTNTNFHLPASPTEQQIQFRLYTVHNRHTPDILDALNTLTFHNSHWDSNLDTKVIVHGFTDSADAAWANAMAQELLHHVALNVIIVDWSTGAAGPNYYQATANTRVVGAQIATLIMTAEAMGSSRYKFHVIGHSLGAQIAGYAGSALGGHLGRATGLDPAAPLFENYGNAVKLEKSDAQFVDVIHTDAEPLHEAGLGTVDLIGHVDFFPNGGKDMPGCPPSKVSLSALFDGGITALTDDISCSHNRATRYFVASINDNDFRSYPCGSADGGCHLCGDGCSNMGYHAIPDFTGLYVTTTGANYPYNL